MVRRVFSSCFFHLPLIALMAIVGCGGGNAGDGFTGDRGQVSGTATLGGKPLEKGCQVVFMAKDHGYIATGVVDETGAYKLAYSDPNGLPVGEYAVQLTAPVVVSETTAPVDPREMASKMKLNRKSGAAGGEAPFPKKYLSTSSSELAFTVKAGENTINVELEE